MNRYNKKVRERFAVYYPTSMKVSNFPYLDNIVTLLFSIKCTDR